MKYALTDEEVVATENYLEVKKKYIVAVHMRLSRSIERCDAVYSVNSRNCIGSML